MSFIPVAMQLLPLIPGLLDSVFKIVEAVRTDPATPAEAKVNLDALSARLAEVMEHVKNAPLPGA